MLTERVAVEALPVRRIVELGRYPHSGWFGRITSQDRRVVDWAIEAVGARHLAEHDFSRLSDGELMTGAPKDVVLSGALGQAFEGRHIRFHPEERSFRLLTGDRGDAVVHGSGLRASLAMAVLEREGYSVAAGFQACALSVHAHESGWRVLTDDAEWSGADFASLAVFLRGRRTAA